MNLDDILGQLPVDQIAARLGVDHDTATRAVESALPALVGGMQANAQHPDGAASLASALGQHDDDLIGSVSTGGAGLDQVDTQDGEKIVGHVFGEQQPQVVSRLAGSSGVDKALMDRLLPILAPLVLSYLSKRLLGGAGPKVGGIDLGQVLGQVLAGSSSSGRRGGEVDLGDVLGGLGGLLGGGRR